jgi:hypothetical protein
MQTMNRNRADLSGLTKCNSAGTSPFYCTAWAVLLRESKTLFLKMARPGIFSPTLLFTAQLGNWSLLLRSFADFQNTLFEGGKARDFCSKIPKITQRTLSSSTNKFFPLRASPCAYLNRRCECAHIGCVRECDGKKAATSVCNRCLL